MFKLPRRRIKTSVISRETGDIKVPSIMQLMRWSITRRLSRPNGQNVRDADRDCLDDSDMIVDGSGYHCSGRQ